MDSTSLASCSPAQKIVYQHFKGAIEQLSNPLVAMMLREKGEGAMKDLGKIPLLVKDPAHAEDFHKELLNWRDNLNGCIEADRAAGIGLVASADFAEAKSDNGSRTVGVGEVNTSRSTSIDVSQEVSQSQAADS